MREIEIKVRVNDLAALEKVLLKREILLDEPLTQHDEVFGRRGKDGSFIHGEAWLRIRTQYSRGETSVFFTLKRSVAGRQLDSIEHETVVTNADALRAMMPELAYEPYSDLTKIRRTGHVGDIEICVDHVDGLGNFIEAEILTQSKADGAAVEDRLWALFESLGLSREDQVTDGYDVLLNKQKGLPI